MGEEGEGKREATGRREEEGRKGFRRREGEKERGSEGGEEGRVKGRGWPPQTSVLDLPVRNAYTYRLPGPLGKCSELAVTRPQHLRGYDPG